MIVIPAIDVRGGRCVRLRQGDYARETVYGTEPMRVARDFVAAGARRMHIVDLDAARGRPDASTEMAVRRAVWAACEDGCAVQVGGGVRTPQDTGRWLAEGAAFVVLGSLAVRDPELTRQICQTYEGKVLLALDVRDGDARISGWTEPGGAMEDVLRSWRGRPSAGVVFTGTDRDGMLDGPDLDGLDRCRALYEGDVYVSGGITTSEDVDACAAHGAAGVVIGRALYEGNLDLGELLREFPVPVS